MSETIFVLSSSSTEEVKELIKNIKDLREKLYRNLKNAADVKDICREIDEHIEKLGTACCNNLIEVVPTSTAEFGRILIL